MVEQTDPFMGQGQHEAARAILRRHFNDEVKRATAQHLNAVYYQSQIDYDREHEHSNKKDIPKHEKLRDEAKAALAEHEKLAGELREALKALGEVFRDDEYARHASRSERPRR